MYTTGNKKKLNMLILEILKEYSGEDKPIRQKEIKKKIEELYGLECDRRTVKNNIDSLIDMGYEIDYDKGYRLKGREFDDSELRILIDLVLFSKTIPKHEVKNLVDKLKGLSNQDFSKNTSRARILPVMDIPIKNQAIYALNEINLAIADKHKIEFIYNDVGTDFKLHPKRNKPDKVSPYEIVINNGRFYLICNYEKHDNIAHIRIDRMTNIKILEKEEIKPQSKIPELKKNFDLHTHMAEHFYMFGGESVYAKIKTSTNMMGNLTDWFGNFKIIEDKDGQIIIMVKCNRMALRIWALQYGPYAEVLEPEDLREEIKDDIAEMYKKYNVEK